MDTHEKIDVQFLNTVAWRAARRKNILTEWTRKDEELRKVVRDAQCIIEYGKPESEEDEDEEEEKKDLNALYAESVEEEEEMGVYELYQKVLPTLNDVIYEALTHNETVNIKPIDRAREKIDRGNSEEGSENLPDLNHVPILKSDLASAESNKEQGHFSSRDVENLLATNIYEKQKSVQEIVDLIPKIDREQYLNNWLQNGVQNGLIKHLPSPPPATLRTKKYRMKYQKIAESEASFRDVVPLDNELYYGLLKGRLRSAMSIERPGTASTCYTGRDSVLSTKENSNSEDDDVEEDNIEQVEDDRDDQEITKHKKTLKLAKDTTIIYDQINENDETIKREASIIKKDDPVAWKFYRKQQHDIQNAKKMKTNRRSKSPPIKITVKELLEKEKEYIFTSNAIKLGDLFDKEEEEACDIEILQVDKNEVESDSSTKDQEKHQSVTPPLTPWKPLPDRPLTPDSHDSEAELDKLWNEYLESHSRRMEEDRLAHEPKREWQSYVKKKSTKPSPPPAPKIGWKANQKQSRQGN